MLQRGRAGSWGGEREWGKGLFEGVEGRGLQGEGGWGATGVGFEDRQMWGSFKVLTT